MSQNIKYILFIILAILLFAGGVFTQKSCQKCPEIPIITGTTSHTWTDIEVKPKPPLDIDSAKGRVIYKTKFIYVDVPSYVADSMVFMRVLRGNTFSFDSVKISELYTYYLAEPNTYKLDTISNGDTLKVIHEMPINLFWVDMKPKPDSIFRYYRIDSVRYKENTSWYLGAGIHAGIDVTGKVSVGASLQFGYKIKEW